MEIKSMKGWVEQNGDFTKYVRPNERITENLYDYFETLMPPASYELHGFLMGEPMDTDSKGEYTWLAFVKLENKYWYAGEWTIDDFRNMSKEKFYDHFHPRLFDLNERGNALFHTNIMMSDVYRYDRCLDKKAGWFNYPTPQDAEYYGVYANHELKTIISYVEGDEYIVCCCNQERYDREYWVMQEFHSRQ